MVCATKDENLAGVLEFHLPQGLISLLSFWRANWPRLALFILYLTILSCLILHKFPYGLDVFLDSLFGSMVQFAL